MRTCAVTALPDVIFTHLSAVRRFAPIALVILLTGGCATATEWTTWHTHGTHFASDDHLSFSVRNQEESTPRVTRRDLVAARREGWWGDAVTVRQDQILKP